MNMWRACNTTTCWAYISRTGVLLADSTFVNAADAWCIALGWPSEEEIEDAKRKGDRVQRVSIVAVKEQP